VLNFCWDLVLHFWLNFMLNLGFNFMLNFVLDFMLYFVLDLMLNLMLNFMFWLVLSFMFYWLSLLVSHLLRLLSLFSLSSSFLLFRVFFIFGILLRPLLELLGNITNSSPILSMLFLLSSHFDEEPPGKNLFIKASPDKVDSVNFAFEDYLEGTRVVFFDLDQMKLRKCFLNILLNCIEVAFN